MLVEILRKHTPQLLLFLEWVTGRKKAILIDYPPICTPRYGGGTLKHPQLERIISGYDQQYHAVIDQLRPFLEPFNSMKARSHYDSNDPIIDNGFLPEFDAFALYSLLANHAPTRYFEIGSGHSTRFARKAITDFNLSTTILSIDPAPRLEIDQICDSLIKDRVENVDLRIFSELKKGDVLFVDNSHRIFQNSDATVCLLDILPILAPGVLIQFHDITLPWDYPAEYGAGRYYSEQYVLAAYILAEGPRFEIVLPNYYVTHSSNFRQSITPLDIDNFFGSSFWLRTT